MTLRETLFKNSYQLSSLISKPCMPFSGNRRHSRSYRDALTSVTIKSSKQFLFFIFFNAFSNLIDSDLFAKVRVYTTSQGLPDFVILSYQHYALLFSSLNCLLAQYNTYLLIYFVICKPYIPFCRGGRIRTAGLLVPNQAL
jgi:hypothetical protein